MPVGNDKNAEQQAVSGQDCKFTFYLEFVALQWIPVQFFKRVSTSTSPCACFGYEHH